MSKSGPETEKDWWLNHLGEMAEHNRRVYERHELRARYVLVVLGLVIAAIRLAEDQQLDLPTFESWILGIWIILLCGSAVLLVTVLAPLRGRRFFAGSIEASAVRMVVGSGRHSKALRILLGLRDIGDLAPYPLSADFRRAATDGGLAGFGARRVLVGYIERNFRSDLTWWLCGTDEEPVDDDLYDIRRRQIFWYWSNLEAANRKGVLLEAALSLALRPAVLLALMVAIMRSAVWAAGFLA